MNVNENMMREESSLALSSIKVKDDDLLFFSSAANSPPSSAFVSALQSPYISPRAVPPPDLITIIKTKTESPSSSSSSPSFSTEEEEELPSTSYTPPSDPYEFSDSTTPPPPRISFSFPTLPCPSSSNNNNSNSKLRSCDVFIGFCGQSAPAGLLRFCRWLKAHLELHGIACFLADRSSYSDSHSHDVADRLICSAAFGVVVVTPASASNRLSLEEIHFFSHKKNFVPVLFSFHPPPADPLLSSAFLASPDASDWRRCVASASAFLRARLAREPSPRAAEESESETDSEVPFPRNPGFRGREEELREMEDAVVAGKVRGKAVVCVSGAGGVGKTELALEFAHRHRQRYAAVVWVGGEGRHLRHNMLQLSVRLGVDVSSAERERGRVGFEEQEREALRRVKRELFRDIPYLIVIDNLDSSADPNDFLPPHHHNSAGITASHVIITTSVTSAVTFPVTVHLNPLPLPHSLSLLLSDSSSSSSLAALNHRLGGLPLAVVLARSLLSTLTPSALLQNLDNDESEEEDVNKLISMCLSSAGQAAAGMADVAAWLASSPALARLIWRRRKTHWWKKDESEEGAKELARLNLGRISKRRDGSTWIQLHPRAAEFVRKTRPGGAKEAVERVIAKAGGGGEHWDHLWASAFLVFGYKGQAPAVELAGDRMVRYVRTRALPLANAAFAQFSRCSSAVELLKVCSDALEDLEKSFVSQIQRTSSSSASSRLLCFACGEESVDECVWQHVTLLKATLLETRAKLLMRGGYFDAAEEVCRTCISIRTVMLGHAHPLTLAAHHTLAAIVRIRTNFL